MGERGRPTKYSPEMCDTAIELMREGASKTEVCAELGISFETLGQWTDPESEYFKADFSEAVKRGMQLCQAWWERRGRTSLENKDFSYTGWYMNMKNRFRWADRQETKHEGSLTVNIDSKDAGTL